MALVKIPTPQPESFQEKQDWRDYLGAGLELGGTVAGGIIGGIYGNAPGAIAGAQIGHSAGSFVGSLFQEDKNAAAAQRNAAMAGAFRTGPLAARAFGGQDPRALPQAQPELQFATPQSYLGAQGLSNPFGSAGSTATFMQPQPQPQDPWGMSLSGPLPKPPANPYTSMSLR